MRSASRFGNMPGRTGESSPALEKLLHRFDGPTPLATRRSLRSCDAAIAIGKTVSGPACPFLRNHLEQIAMVVQLDLHDPAIRIEADFACERRIDPLSIAVAQPRFELAAERDFVVEEILRRRGKERLRAEPRPLADEDRTGLLRSLAQHGRIAAERKRAAQEGRDEDVRLQAHERLIHALDGAGKSAARSNPTGNQSAPISLSFFKTWAFGSPVCGRR